MRPIFLQIETSHRLTEQAQEDHINDFDGQAIGRYALKVKIEFLLYLFPQV